MSEVGLGIIGAGNIAREHLKVIQAMPGVKAMGISSRTLDKAEELARNYDIDQVYKTPKNLLKNSTPDGLMVLVSADQIYDVVTNLIPERIPLFIEKPPGLNPKQTSSLVKLADRYGTQSMVGFNRRYYSVFRKGLEIIKKHGNLLGLAVEGHERFWKIACRNLTSEIRESWIYANSTHTIDLLRYFGGELRSISVLSRSLIEKKGDQFVASFEFESGALGTYSSHWLSPGGWSVTLYGEGVTVIFKPLEGGFWLDTDFNRFEIEPDEVDSCFKPGFYAQLDAFCEKIRHNQLKWPGQDLSDVLMTMKLVEKFVCT